MCVDVGVCATVYLWKSEDIFMGSVLFFHLYIGLRVQTLLSTEPRHWSSTTPSLLCIEPEPLAH